MGEKTCSFMGRLHITKMSIIHKMIYRFKATLNKISGGFFGETEKTILKFIRKCTEPKIEKILLKIKTRLEDIT